jgi:neutral ceramidase
VIPRLESWSVCAYPPGVRRIRRILLRAGAGVAGISVVVLLLALDRVDPRPYLHEAYYAETVARLKSVAATNVVVRGELSAGFGRALLSPTVNTPEDDPMHGRFRAVPLAGYGNRHGKPATGVHDDLFVKAVALRVGERVGVMVGADALIIPHEVAEAAVRQLEEELHLTREQLYLSATHTHSSLGGWGEGMVAEAFAGGFQPGVRIWFADRIVTAVREAVGDLKPAAFGHGRFSAPEFVRNRLVGHLGGVDPEFTYVVLKQHGGKVAVLGSYAAHATVLSGDSMGFSADYPGCWERAIEDATGGSAVFLAGGVGSHSPLPPEKGFAGAEQMGRSLAATLIEQLPHAALTNRIAFGLLGLDLSLPPLNVRVTDGIRLQPWLAKRLMRAQDHVLLQAFRLDDLLWLSTPCDFSGELALRIKDGFRARGGDAVVTSFNGGYVGYVIPTRYYHLDGYEPRLMSFFGPNVPDYFEEMMRALALSLADN